MMGLVEIIDLIKGVLQFPGVILQFIQLLRKTPEQKHEELMIGIRKEAQKFEDTGRPTW